MGTIVSHRRRPNSFEIWRNVSIFAFNLFEDEPMPFEMKRINALILSLLCVLLYSCQKDQQDMLVGIWEVSSKTTQTTGNTDTTRDNPILYYKFEASGEGRIISPEATPIISDMDDGFFTYTYDIKKSTIEFESWAKKEKSSWIVDKLTDVSFICHSSANGSSTSFNGRKMK